MLPDPFLPPSVSKQSSTKPNISSASQIFKNKRKLSFLHKFKQNLAQLIQFEGLKNTLAYQYSSETWVCSKYFLYEALTLRYFIIDFENKVLFFFFRFSLRYLFSKNLKWFSFPILKIKILCTPFYILRSEFLVTYFVKIMTKIATH